VLYLYKADIIVSSKYDRSRHDIAENCSFGVKQQSLTLSLNIANILFEKWTLRKQPLNS